MPPPVLRKVTDQKALDFYAQLPNPGYRAAAGLSVA